MNDLITHVKDVLETTYPSYKLIVSEVHDYYNLPFSTFACKDNTLIIHISFYIKPINQESLYMYDIEQCIKRICTIVLCLACIIFLYLSKCK